MAEFVSNVLVGSLNMSHASDAKKDSEIEKFNSEYSFHLRDLGRPRRFWNNAKLHLFSFIKEKNPLAVGLQEMNLTDDQNKGGTAEIKAGLDREVYEMVSDKVATYNAGISIIFNKSVAGKVLNQAIVDNPNQLNGPSTNPIGGRPLLMVYTEKGYLFVNMHGAQDATLGNYENNFNRYMVKNNKEFLQDEVKKFLNVNNIVPDHIFIMGDFNDRYDAIKDFDINGVSVTYEGESPKSCCHNWDSMGNATNKRKIFLEKPDEGVDIPNPNISKKEQGIAPATFDEKKVLIPDEHGITVNDYINKGDKVFASGESGPLQIYKSDYNLDENGVSIASDHELVYMEIGGTVEGGKSRKSKKSRKSRKSIKSRKSRKSRKSKKSRK
jgi:hypothetical protein